MLSLDSFFLFSKLWSPCSFVLRWLIYWADTSALDLEICHELWISTEHDVSSAARHICRNGYSTLGTSASNDRSFTFMLLRIKNFVLHAILCQEGRELFRFFNRDCTDKDRLALAMLFDDILCDCGEFSDLSLVDEIWLICALARLISWNRDYTELVDLHKFSGFSHRCTCHT